MYRVQYIGYKADKSIECIKDITQNTFLYALYTLQRKPHAKLILPTFNLPFSCLLLCHINIPFIPLHDSIMLKI